MTGTPIQNNVKELHSLIAFLQVDTLQDAAIFSRAIEKPIKNSQEVGIKTLQASTGGNEENSYTCWK